MKKMLSVVGFNFYTCHARLLGPYLLGTQSLLPEDQGVHLGAEQVQGLTKEQTGDQETIEKHCTNFCNDLKLNENHFCY